VAEQLRVGVVGAGAMGADHVRTLVTAVPAARVTRVFDPDRARAGQVAGAAGAREAAEAAELVRADDVDAVVVASPDRTHAELVLACLELGKPVLCEKPLATDATTARALVDAESGGGRHLVQVGFMRRYDPGFVELRSTLRSGAIGRPRLLHAVHRNASSSTSTDDSGLVTGSMIHELDTLPWLLDQPLVGIRIESPVTDGFRDPQLATLWFADGTMATVEVFVNAGYGYDVRCEVVGTGGTASLSPAASVTTRVAGAEHHPIRDDFVAHFADAYRRELAAWVHSCLDGVPGGPSAWDGYVALVAAAAGVASLASGGREPVDPGPRPAFYDLLDPTGAR
jgi:myo-inositol 2-dehydrogenase / D-chiro-inositol 1-dehydrogenase